MDNSNEIAIIRFAINATNGKDVYDVGFRNGLKYALFVLTGEEPVFDSVGDKTHD